MTNQLEEPTPTQSTDVATLTVAALLSRLNRATEALNRVAARRDLGLPVQQAQAAMFLSRKSDCTVGELAEALDISPAWASRLAEELVSAGHVIRERDREDRRIARLQIVPLMRERSEEILRNHASALARALEKVSHSDIRATLNVLSCISQEYEALAAEPDEEA